MESRNVEYPTAVSPNNLPDFGVLSPDEILGAVGHAATYAEENARVFWARGSNLELFWLEFATRLRRNLERIPTQNANI